MQMNATTEGQLVLARHFQIRKILDSRGQGRFDDGFRIDFNEMQEEYVCNNDGGSSFGARSSVTLPKVRGSNPLFLLQSFSSFLSVGNGRINLRTYADRHSWLQ